MKIILSKILMSLGNKNLINWLSDTTYIKICYYLIFNKKLNLDNPQTFNEKLQYLKLYNRNVLYTKLVDKYEVRSYIEKKIGKDYLIPILWCGDNYNEIPYDKLPNKFVIKCTHGSHCNIICEDKDKLDKEMVKNKLKKWLKLNWYGYAREWPYKNVKPRIIIEKYMIDNKTKELRDYKFFCFNGEVKCFKIDFNRFKDHHANYYSENGELLPFGEAALPPDYNVKIEMPHNLTIMKKYASILAKNIPFVRVDFYEINEKIYFGEMTFFPAAGLGKFTSLEWDNKLGEWLNLK